MAADKSADPDLAGRLGLGALPRPKFTRGQWLWIAAGGGRRPDRPAHAVRRRAAGGLSLPAGHARRSRDDGQRHRHAGAARPGRCRGRGLGPDRRGCWSISTIT
ncbi:MAG: hypothetical protein WDM81_16685 [Rhizomicrobium sp.]